MTTPLDLSQIMLRENALHDKIVVITGGGTGLGKSMATGFLHLGARVVITSRRQEVLDAAKQELEASWPGKILACACDVRDASQVEALLQFTLDHAGIPDILVNNAAGNFISPTEKLSHRAFDTVVDIVLKGSYNTSLTFGKHWIGKKHPAMILNIVTTYAWTGSGYVTPSACAKAGVLSLTRSLAVEWGPKGIRCNAIAPGPFPTKGAWDRLFPGNLAKKLSPELRVPLGRTGEHIELVNLATYLASPYAAYINGEVVTIDGGEWLKGAGQFNIMGELKDEDWEKLNELRMKK
ncbi:MAG: SDR family oxidoreductase [Flavobacteriales bacterium]|nr:SDR family oxidoreductase [Flavobacteriales bacterium]